ncbi:cyclin-dependent protein kinase inhibitor SMR13-like [Diospyros lotus]|uniref:cyclin-dependent protein kinase inhibitor SMR13-like n=1 Tax=Diospyros lotus TaxID=55363 RepID=UPI00225A7E00|nr:cyclin-dependent protein kinase inhibitor SMR13-like [Diospyros lotus]
MSTDLEFRQGLPQLRIPTITIEPSEPPATVQTPNSDECHTPTSPETRIPEVRSCPPAPKKPRRRVSCKRRLSDELQFFEIVAREEIESFFRSSFSAGALKRKYSCI